MSSTDWLISAPVVEIPEFLEQVPGVWPKKNGAGFMVPFNTIGLWGQRPIPNSLSREIGIRRFEDVILSDKRIKLYPELFEHQIDMLCFAFARMGCNIWGPPASGKTRVGTYWLFGDKPPYLVVCKSANIDVWRREIEKWSFCRAQILSSQKASKLALMSDEKHINLISWELLPYWFDVIAEVRPTSIVFDEAHMAKNYRRVSPIVDEEGNTTWKSKENWSDIARKIAGIVKRRLCMTGTPIANTRIDLYSQLDIAEPFAWGSVSGWGKRYVEFEETEYGIKYGKKGNNTDELKTRLSFSAIRLSLAQIAKTLPPFRREVITIRLDQQVRVVGGIKAELNKLGGENVLPGSEGSATEILILEAASRKRKYIVTDIVDSIKSGQKVCILTGRRVDVEFITERITKELKADATNRIFMAHGGLSDKACDSAIDGYLGYVRGPLGCCLIGTGHKLGTGLNLQDTDIGMIVQTPDTPERIQQWEMRWVRPGRIEPVLIRYYIAEGTIDEDMRSLILDKLDDLKSLLADDQAESILKSIRPISNVRLLDRIRACLNPAANHEAKFSSEVEE